MGSQITDSIHDTQHQGLVYTQVYTGVENSGLLGPHTSKWSQSETALAKRISPALSTWDLLRPQHLKLFANETLYQLSYTPKRRRNPYGKLLCSKEDPQQDQPRAAPPLAARLLVARQGAGHDAHHLGHRMLLRGGESNASPKAHDVNAVC